MKRYNSKKRLSLWLLLLLLTYPVLSQPKMISGTINDETGNSVANALITIKEQPGIKVFTDNEGNFNILGETGQFLEVTTRDHRYKSLRIEADRIDVTLNDNDELIPVGNRMERRKEELTSAIGIVRANELTKSSVWNPANALYGKIPGLTVLQNGGINWNSSPDITIRGVETFGIGSFVNTDILVMVDGFERPISSLSLAEIESVAVLKDASALALYGLRGANGVLLITTKRGTGKGLSVDINYERGITRAFRVPEFLDAYGYASAVNQAHINDGTDPLYSQPELERFRSGNSPYLYPNVNWLDESLRDFGWSNKFNISFQEQSSAVRYFAIINYENEEGLFAPVNLNTGYSTQSTGRKFNFRTNIDIDVTKSTILTVNIAGNLGENNSPSTSSGENDIFSAIYNTPSSAFPVKTYNRSLTSPEKNWGGTTTYGAINPVALISATGYTRQGIRELMSDFILEQKLDKVLKGLSAEIGLSSDKSFNYIDAKTRQFQYEEINPIIDPATSAVIDTAENLYGNTTTLSFSTSVPAQWRRTTALVNLKYEKDWGDNELSSMLLFQREELVKSGRNNTFRHLLAAGTVHYGKAGKYFADLSLAYNGTNVLPKGNRTGLFPALSIGWNVSNKEWFSKNQVFDYLKLRASWGIAGNDQVIQNINMNPWDGGTGYYFRYNNIASGGYREGRLASSPLTFETSYKTNIGIDASMFKLLDLNLDVFYNKRKGILVETGGTISGVLGAYEPYSSAGITTNKGIELGLNLHKDAGYLRYHVSGQLSYIKSKIIDMLEVYRPEEYLKRTGQSINQAFGLEAIGFFASDADIAASPNQTFSILRPGDIKYKDQNGDDIINSFDEIPVGYNTKVPEFYYSGSVGLEFKGFGFDMFLQGIANQTIYLNTPSIFIPLRANANISTFSNDAWTEATAATAVLPRLSMLENSNNYQPNSIWCVNGSYLKLRSLELYFDFPRQMASRLKLSDVRIYVRGMNLLSIDKIKIVDPEEIGSTHPTMSSYNLGIKIGF